MKRMIAGGALAVALLFGTGCFRVGSDTRALRDVALEFGGGKAEEQIEFGAGFFTVGLVKLGAKCFDIPIEAKQLLASVDGAECSVYELRGGKADFAELLNRADAVMTSRGRERVVGVLDGRQLVAIYVPRNASGTGSTSISVLVLDGRQLVCATARGDLQAVMDIALAKGMARASEKSRKSGA